MLKDRITEENKWDKEGKVLNATPEMGLEGSNKQRKPYIVLIKIASG